MGVYPGVPPVAARGRRGEARGLLPSGVDPLVRQAVIDRRLTPASERAVVLRCDSRGAFATARERLSDRRAAHAR